MPLRWPQNQIVPSGASGYVARAHAGGDRIIFHPERAFLGAGAAQQRGRGQRLRRLLRQETGGDSLRYLGLDEKEGLGAKINLWAA